MSDHAHTPTWPRVALVAIYGAVASFLLWLGASHFDGGELRTLIGLVIGSALREFGPLASRINEAVNRGRLE